jgi:hypothetical protein
MHAGRKGTTTMALSLLARHAKEMWEIQNPKLVRELKRQGVLDEYLEKAADLASEVMAELIAGGASYDQAMELVAREYLPLPPRS